MKNRRLSKLTGRIVEYYDTRKSFSEKLGMTPITLSKKLNGDADFKSSEIMKIADLLHIPTEQIADYFFNETSE